jgi:hypothetical protein
MPKARHPSFSPVSKYISTKSDVGRGRGSQKLTVHRLAKTYDAHCIGLCIHIIYVCIIMIIIVIIIIIVIERKFLKKKNSFNMSEFLTNLKRAFVKMKNTFKYETSPLFRLGITQKNPNFQKKIFVVPAFDAHKTFICCTSVSSPQKNRPTPKMSFQAKVQLYFKDGESKR